MRNRLLTSMGRFVTIIMLIAGIGAAVQPQPAFAYTSHYNNAKSYADRYACNPPTTCRNTSVYRTYSEDCTNFMSQALYAGGFPQQNAFTSWPWTYGATYTSESWYNVGTFLDVLHTNGYLSGLSRITSLGSAYTAATIGDLYAYDWGKGLGVSHLSMEVGWGTRASMYSGDGQGDYIDQHTTDRYHSPWNYGYLHPDSNTSVSNMKIYLVTVYYTTA